MTSKSHSQRNDILDAKYCRVRHRQCRDISSDSDPRVLLLFPILRVQQSSAIGVCVRSAKNRVLQTKPQQDVATFEPFETTVVSRGSKVVENDCFPAPCCGLACSPLFWATTLE